MSKDNIVKLCTCLASPTNYIMIFDEENALTIYSKAELDELISDLQAFRDDLDD